MPICKTCNDTHSMWYSKLERNVMCTFCPVPCQKCRSGGNGPFCTNTPCDCACHERHHQYAGVTGPSYYLEEKIIRVIASEIGPEMVLQILKDIMGKESIIRFVREFIKEKK